MAEDSYSDLINSIDEGFCVIDVIFDDTGKPVDLRYLERSAFWFAILRDARQLHFILFSRNAYRLV